MKIYDLISLPGNLFRQDYDMVLTTLRCIGPKKPESFVSLHSNLKLLTVWLPLLCRITILWSIQGTI